MDFICRHASPLARHSSEPHFINKVAITKVILPNINMIFFLGYCHRLL